MIFYIRSLIDPDLEKFADKWYEIQKTVKSKKQWENVITMEREKR